MSAMYPWERMKSQRGRTQVSTSPTAFTPEGYAKLATLRLRLQDRAVDLELGIDERGLRFARWLVEHGKLSEDISAR